MGDTAAMKPSTAIPSVCPLDCPDTCSLDVVVDDGRLTKVRGSDANPYTAGAVCEKVVKYYPHLVHGDTRLTRPLLRSGPPGGGDFRAVSWDQALERIHRDVSARIARHGGETVLPLNYAGPHGQLAGASMDRRFFHRLGATRVDRGPLCGAVRGGAYASLFGNVPGLPPEQAANAELVAVWGNNVTVSNLHLARQVKRAREAGARLLVVDSRRTRIAEQAHLFVQPKPGTDVVLALALAAELERRDAVDRDFAAHWAHGLAPYLDAAHGWSAADAVSICGITAGQFSALADAYCATSRIALSIGNGIERGRNGGSALRAIMALSVLRGAFGTEGAGVIARHSAAFPWTPDALQRPDLAPPGIRTINIVDTGRLLLDRELDPPIDAVFIYNHNPVCTHPDQNRMRRALSREGLFTVGIDVAMTDSMRYADVVLPAATHFEFADIYGAYGQTWLQRAEPVMAPVGESLPNTGIFRRLAARFGFDEPCFADDDNALIRAAIDADDPRLGGVSPDRLSLDAALSMSGDGTPPLLTRELQPATPSGLIELYSDDLERRFGCGLPGYRPPEAALPLNLISPSSSRRTNSTFGGHPDSLGAERLEIHPDDAAARGIVDGDRVEVGNGLGRVTLRARVSDRVTPGVVYSPKGTWLASSDSGQTVNALIPADLRADIMDGACYNDTFVEATPVHTR